MSSNLPFQSNIIMNPLASKQSNILPGSSALKHAAYCPQANNHHVPNSQYICQVRHYNLSGKRRPSENLSFNYPQRLTQSRVQQFTAISQKVLEENKREEIFERTQLIYSKQKEAGHKGESTNNSCTDSNKKQSRFHPLIISTSQKNKEGKCILQKKVELGSKIPTFMKTKSMKNEQANQLYLPLKNAQANNTKQSKTDREMMSRKQNHANSNFYVQKSLKLRHQLSGKEHKQANKQLKQFESALNQFKEFSAVAQKKKIEEEKAMVSNVDQSLENGSQSLENGSLGDKNRTVTLFQQFSPTQKEEIEQDVKVERREAKKKSNFQFFKNIKKKKLTILLQQSQKSFQFSDFDVIDKIGKGAFGDVFVAQQKVSGFICVLKKLSKKKLKEQKLEQQMLRQIKIQSYLNHRHLTSLYGCFDDEKNIYLILQLLPDGSLSKNKRKIPQNEASAYIKQISLGLKYMHTQNVIHRDIKPQNIFLNQGYAKIGDFGCSIYTNTYRNSQIGSLAYISPEQLKLEKYNQKIDVWSLGVIAYEMLLGVSPFENQILKITKRQIAPQLSELTFPDGTMLSTEAKSFLMGVLNNDPQKRFEIQEALQHQFIQKHNKLEDTKLQKMGC